jgi:hypothetical protein
MRVISGMDGFEDKGGLSGDAMSRVSKRILLAMSLIAQMIINMPRSERGYARTEIPITFSPRVLGDDIMHLEET